MGDTLYETPVRRFPEPLSDYFRVADQSPIKPLAFLLRDRSLAAQTICFPSTCWQRTDHGTVSLNGLLRTPEEEIQRDSRCVPVYRGTGIAVFSPVVCVEHE
jgi:hypothetical protein